jgi:hypothetical protein
LQDNQNNSENQCKHHSAPAYLLALSQESGEINKILDLIINTILLASHEKYYEQVSNRAREVKSKRLSFIQTNCSKIFSVVKISGVVVFKREGSTT